MKLILVKASVFLGGVLVSTLVGCSGANSSSTAETGGTGSGSDASASGGATSGTGGATSTGSNGATGGTSATGGSSATGGATSGTGGSTDACNDAALVWKSANKTNYTSYPDPNSIECLPPEQGGYNGCMWKGQFAGCSGVKSEAWVESHNIVALFPNFNDYELHNLCIKSGDKVMIVTVYDTCGDADCDGCCTENKGDKDALIDLEKYTNQRFGVDDGVIQWADLGPSADGCAGE